MPSITIDVCRNYSAAEGRALLDAVHEALMQAFGVPFDTRNLLLCIHAPERFIGKPGVESADRMTNITIHCMHGRSIAAKRRLYAGIVKSLEALGIPPACVLIRLIEMPPENFGVLGGQALCDVELDYTVKV
jgi:phenylpyruvate tautomerase PptA (4-oxalocrotonate tautomerase family)